ncbi:MAG TPA: peptidase S8, partial [Kribbella sp.]|nr:peptidase S8 [Kribbella sp.]
MSRTSRPRRLAAGLSAAALVCVSLGATTTANAADPEPGPLMNYVVNTKATPGHVRKTEDAVKAAGGSVLMSYRQFGVVIAQSTNPDFTTDVRTGHNGKEVQSVGATRTAAVSEGAGGLNAISATPTPDPREGDQWDMVQIKADQ